MPLETPIADLIAQLRRVGVRPPERLVATILEYGPAAVGPLLKLATDVALFDEPEPVCWAPLHALRLLGELPDPAIIDPLLERLPVSVRGPDDLPAQMWGNESVQMIGRCGAAALPHLWERANDTSRDAIARGLTVQAITYAAVMDAAQREPLIMELRRRFEDEADPTFCTFLVTALGVLGDNESYAAVMAAYRAGRLSSEILPSADARQLLLGGGDPAMLHVRISFWERYEQHGPFPRPE